MKFLKYVALLSTLALVASVNALARDKNQRSVDIPDAVQVGTAHLQSGKYRVEWNGTGPNVQVTFLREGNTVATVPATLKTNDDGVIQDDVVTDVSDADAKVLKEIDFGRQKEALVFNQSGM
jgi:hypothetical protein